MYSFDPNKIFNSSFINKAYDKDASKPFEGLLNTVAGSQSNVPAGVDPNLVFLANQANNRADALMQLYSPEGQRQLLQSKLAFDRDQMAQALPYNLLYQLPGQITDAFAKPAAIALAGKLGMAEGIGKAAALRANMTANIPALSTINSTSFNYTPRTYI